MIKITDKTKCCGCGACKEVCPTNAISIIPDKYGFVYPVADTSKCVNCKKCDSVCPMPVWSEKQNKPLPLVSFAAAVNDENIKLHSSSGGLFSALGLDIINDGGVVFGAVFDGLYTVRHTKASDKDEILPMCGSKYVQCTPSDIFTQVKTELLTGKKVMFTGTPCQCAALKSFLDKNYDNLLTVDFVCNSVPSSLILRKYLECVSGGRIIKSVNFRDKQAAENGNLYAFTVTFSDGTLYTEQQDKSRYMNALLGKIITRASCSDCVFRKYERASDITFGDFWGIEKTYPEFYDRNGTSLVVASTEKGENMLNKISDKITLNKTDFETSIKNNPAFNIQSSAHISRNMFLAEFDKKEITANLSDCFNPSVKFRLKRQYYSKKGDV